MWGLLSLDVIAHIVFLKAKIPYAHTLLSERENCKEFPFAMPCVIPTGRNQHSRIFVMPVDAWDCGFVKIQHRDRSLVSCLINDA